MITEFGRLLRKHRQKRKLLLGDLNHLGIGRAKLSGYECGKEIIPDKLIFKIVSFLELGTKETYELLNADKTTPLTKTKPKDELSIAILDLTRST